MERSPRPRPCCWLWECLSSIPPPLPLARSWTTSQQIARANPIEELRKLKNDDAERIGEEEIDGRKTQVYRLKKADFIELRLGEGDTAKLWVDPKTGLPVRIRIDGQTPASRGPSDK